MADPIDLEQFARDCRAVAAEAEALVSVVEPVARKANALTDLYDAAVLGVPSFVEEAIWKEGGFGDMGIALLKVADVLLARANDNTVYDNPEWFIEYRIRHFERIAAWGEQSGDAEMARLGRKSADEYRQRLSA